jgi:hypothetical protein
MWVRLDDEFAESPKVEKLSDKAFRAHVIAMCYCGRHLTDGRVSRSRATTIAFMVDNDTVVRELLDAGLWERDGKNYKLHDWQDYNPTKTKVLEERAKAKERKERWKERQKNAVPNTVPERVPNASPSRPVPSQSPLASSGSIDPSEEEESAEPSEAPSAPASLPGILTFPVSGRNGKKTWELQLEFVKELEEAFPAVDVLAECRKALMWIKTSPAKKKTHRGMGRFITSWMSRCQDRGGSKGTATEPATPTAPVCSKCNKNEAVMSGLCRGCFGSEYGSKGSAEQAKEAVTRVKGLVRGGRDG